MDDRQFKRLLGELGYSFEGYRRVRKGVKKRIRRHMRDLACRDMTSYLGRIAASPQNREACIRRMAVPISRFMRDRPLWDALQGGWLSELHRRFGPRLQAWSAGCACGEEAYSLMIAARETSVSAVQMDITATDLNPVCLAKARAGVYPASSLREMPADLLSRYFSPLRRGRRYRIRPDLMDGISWCCRLTENPWPGHNYGLILLRNSVLTYCEAPQQTRVLAKVLACLRPGGTLVIGSQEKLPASLTDMAPVSASWPYVFRKITGV
jgi:chemotaxis protein methyltransferase CheR